MQLRAPAIILAVRAHGEHGAIVRALTKGQGVQPGYVRGGRSTRLRPVLQPGNLVLGDWRARTEVQIAALTVELAQSRAPLFAEPLAAAAITWVTTLAAVALPEGQPYPRLFDALGGLLEAIALAPAARDWAAALVRFELLVLAELGFGLDQRAGATMPLFLTDGGAGDWPQIIAALKLTGYFLRRDVLSERRSGALGARDRLIDRLYRVVA